MERDDDSYQTGVEWPESLKLQKCVGYGILTADDTVTRSRSDSFKKLPPHPKGRYRLRCFGSSSNVTPSDILPTTGNSTSTDSTDFETPTTSVIELQRISDHTRQISCLGSLIYCEEGAAIKCNGLSLELAEAAEDEDSSDHKKLSTDKRASTQGLNLWVPLCKIPVNSQQMTMPAPIQQLSSPSTTDVNTDTINEQAGKPPPSGSINRTDVTEEKKYPSFFDTKKDHNMFIESRNPLLRVMGGIMQDSKSQGILHVAGHGVTLLTKRIVLMSTITRDSLTDLKSPFNFASHTWHRITTIGTRMSEIGNRCQHIARRASKKTEEKQPEKEGK